MMPRSRDHGDGGRGEEEEEDEEGDDEEPILVSSLLVNVVGLKYYHGTVTDGELVQLVREPNNMYDPNAIRVLNIRGQQVGHVERGKAAILSSLVDQGISLLEGIVPSGSRNIHRMPCEVFVFSRPSHAGVVLNHLEISGVGSSRSRPGSSSRAGASSSSGAAAGSKRKLPAPEQKKKSGIDEIFESMIGEKKRQTMEADATIVSSTLLGHQKEALAWMVQRENSSALPPFWEMQSRGKKTMYMNTLTNFTCDNRPEPLRGGILADDMGLGKTLTVLALIATNRPGATLPPIEDISGEPEQPEEPRSKKKKPNPKASSSSSSSSGDGAGCVPRAGGPRPTLVVCPLSVLSNWVDQLADHTKQGSLKVHMFHGPGRIKNSATLEGFDIVFTTYNMMATEFKDRNSVLKKVKWLRLVLDEAHLVKNPNAQQTKFVVGLDAERRWAVTGTPIQNNAKDLFSLMQFLHFEPLNERSYWNRTIQRPLTSGQDIGFSRLQGLMQAISLRRTKETKVNGKKLVDLPPKIVTIYPVDLTPEDQKLYDQMERGGKELIQKYLADNSVSKNMASVLQIILRLRQLCSHSGMVPAPVLEKLAQMAAGKGPAIASPELLEKMLAVMDDEFDCPICLSPPVSAVITKCRHVFCQRCIEKSFEREKSKCPMCRADLTSEDIFASNAGEDEEERAEESSKGVKRSSAKITALVSLLEKIRAKDPGIKSVVFSQFATMLNLIEEPLTRAGFKFVKLQGGMSAKKREEALAAFKSTSRSSPTVFLLSLKAAGVGLNLVSASNVFMMDPWWNPAVEEQAMDRVYRLGQTREVHVFRLIASSSIEERMLKIQEKKQAHVEIAMGAAASEKNRQRCIERVRLLLSV